MACGLGVWIGTAYHYSGRISVESLGGALPCVFGTVTSSFVPLPTTIIISLIWPHGGFEWSQLLDIKRVKVEDDTTSDNLEPESEPSVIDPDQIRHMKRMSRIALYWGIFTFVAQFALWPLIMYGSKYIFSRKVCSSCAVVKTTQIYPWISKPRELKSIHLVFHGMGSRGDCMALYRSFYRHFFPSNRRWFQGDLERVEGPYGGAVYYH